LVKQTRKSEFVSLKSPVSIASAIDPPSFYLKFIFSNEEVAIAKAIVKEGENDLNGRFRQRAASEDFGEARPLLEWVCNPFHTFM